MPPKIHLPPIFSPIEMTLPLTQSNLNLLLSQFETTFPKLDQIKYTNTPSSYFWYGPPNTKTRFYNCRRDNKFYNKNLNRTCSCKCEHNKFVRGYDSDNDELDYIDFVCDDCVAEGPNKLFNDCTCDLELCSEGTGPDMDFDFDCNPQKLNYDFIPLEHQTIYDNIPDLLELRTYNFSYDKTRKAVINLKSIPILQVNLIRLNRELTRQNTFKLCMAFIRTLKIYHTTIWCVPDSNGNLVEIRLTRDLVRLIFYWATF